MLGREPIERRIWRFAGCEFDEVQWRLTVREKDVELERKPLRLLFELLQRPNEAITKDELLGAVWPAVVVSEASLTTAVSKLRKALGDEEQRLIVTISGVGYRLAATVTVDAGKAPQDRAETLTQMTPARSRGSDRTLATVAALYDAALDHSLWPDALARLTALTDSQASTFWVLDGGHGSLHPTFVSINFDQRAVDDYVGGMASLDPTVRYLLAHPNAGIVHDGMLGPGDDDDTRRYMDWHVRSVDTRFRLVAQSNLSSGLQAGVALHRAGRVGRFDPAEISRFEVVNGHLRRALAIGVRLGSLSTRQQLTADLLDLNGSAILLLDAEGRVVFMNRAAEDLSARGDGVHISLHGLRLALPQENERLSALVARVAALQQSQRSLAQVMRASRPGGKPPYAIWVNGIAQPPTALTVFRPAVCILISDPERAGAPPAPATPATN